MRLLRENWRGWYGEISVCFVLNLGAVVCIQLPVSRLPTFLNEQQQSVKQMGDDWYYCFKNRADECGLPIPDSPYKTAAVILGVIKAFTDVLKDMPDLLNRPLSQVAQVVFARGAYDASVKQLIEKLASQGMKATARSMGTAGTAWGNVSLAGSILASAYVGGLIGCALYATDKAYFSGRMDDRLTDVSIRIWEWWYDVEAKRQEGQAMEAKLQMMRQLRGLAQQLGVRPSELAEKVLHGGQL